MPKPKPEPNSEASEKPKPPPPLDDYIEVQPVLQMLRIMDRFFDEVVDVEPFRQFHPELHCAYMEILNEELSSYALNLAFAITQLERAFDIDREATVAERG